MREIKEYVRRKKSKNKVIFVYKNKEKTYELFSYRTITNYNNFISDLKLTLTIKNYGFYMFGYDLIQNHQKFNIYLDNKTFNGCFITELEYENGKCNVTISFDYLLIN